MHHTISDRQDGGVSGGAVIIGVVCIPWTMSTNAIENNEFEITKRNMEQTFSSTTRRRGHQHHPRHSTRRRLDTFSRGPAQCGPAGTIKDDDNTSTSDETLSTRVTADSCLNKTNSDSPVSPRITLGTRWRREPTRNKEIEILENEEDYRDNVQERLAQCSPDVPMLSESNDKHDETVDSSTQSPQSSPRGRRNTIDDRKSKTRSKNNSPEPEHAVARARGDGNSDDETTNVEEDPELAELAKLRCPSERTEIQAEREARRRKRCADYPGLAFGSSIFASDTMMKFNLIRNELQNIMGNQLKRVSIISHAV